MVIFCIIILLYDLEYCLLFYRNKGLRLYLVVKPETPSILTADVRFVNPGIYRVAAITTF